MIDFAASHYFHSGGPGLLTEMLNPDQSFDLDQSVDNDWEMHHIETSFQRLPMLEKPDIHAKETGLYEITTDTDPVIGASPV